MKFVVVGGGSMGQRRIRCLLAHQIPVANIRLVEVRGDRRAECKARYGVDSLPSLEEGLAWNPRAVIVSTPTRDHMKCCLAAARAGKDFFCEIALSNSLDGTDELLALVKKHHLIAALGIQTPYHPLVAQAKNWLRDPALGKPLLYRFDWGNYLPGWHPWEHYTDFYDSTQIMGVLAEDLGQLYSFLEDQLADVFARFHHLSSLDIDGPDCIQLMGQTRRGVATSLHFDLMQQHQQTEYRLVCENGVVDVRLFSNPRARRYLNATGQFEVCYLPKGYQYEQCYIDEFGAFLQALADRTEWHHPISDGVHVLRCLRAAEKSNREGRLVSLDPNAPIRQSSDPAEGLCDTARA